MFECGNSDRGNASGSDAGRFFLKYTDAQTYKITVYIFYFMFVYIHVGFFLQFFYTFYYTF